MPGLTINCYDERGEEELEASASAAASAQLAGLRRPRHRLAWHITGEAPNETVQALDSETGHLRARRGRAHLLRRIAALGHRLRHGRQSFVNIIAARAAPTPPASAGGPQDLRAAIGKSARKLKGWREGRAPGLTCRRSMTAVITVLSLSSRGRPKRWSTPQITVVNRVVSDWLKL